MINIVLPEIVLMDTLKAAIEFVRKDYKNNIANTTQSYLYLLLQQARIEKYILFEQAIEVICGKEDSPRLLTIDLAFNMARDHCPSIHITLPAEQTGPGNGMGTDEGYAEAIIEEINEGDFNQDYNNDFDNENSRTSRAVFSRRISATYNIVIVSDNSNEVVFLYHFIRALYIALIPHLHLKGLSNVSFGGQDLHPYNETAHNLHMRAITLSLQYDTFVPSIFPKELLNDVSVNSLPTQE